MRTFLACAVFVLGFVLALPGFAVEVQEPPAPTCYKLVKIDTIANSTYPPFAEAVKGWNQQWEVLSPGAGGVWRVRRTRGDLVIDMEILIPKGQGKIVWTEKKEARGTMELTWDKPPELWCSDGFATLKQMGKAAQGIGFIGFQIWGGMTYGGSPAERFDIELGKPHSFGEVKVGNFTGGFVRERSGSAKVRPRSGITDELIIFEVHMSSADVGGFSVFYHFQRQPPPQVGNANNGNVSPGNTNQGPGNGTNNGPGTGENQNNGPGGNPGGANNGGDPVGPDNTTTPPPPTPPVTPPVTDVPTPPVTPPVTDVPTPPVTPPVTDLPTPPVTPPVPPTTPQPPRMTLLAEHRKVRQGDTVLVPVWLKDAADVANINFTVRYDSAVAVIAGDPIKGNLLTDSLFSANAREVGVVKLGFAGTRGLYGTGTVAVLPFKAVGAPGSVTPLTLAISIINNPAGAVLACDIVNGSITVIDKDAPGDCDGDGSLTAADAQCALDMSVDLRPQQPNMDFDRDGRVTSRDATIILQRATEALLRGNP